MRRVPQKHESDCGVACVAMLAGVSYAIARSAIFGKFQPTYTSAHDLRKAMKKFGINVALRAQRFPRRDPGPTVNALVKSNVRKDSWHWVVWDANHSVFVDPRTPPYTRLRPHSYYSVESS